MERRSNSASLPEPSTAACGTSVTDTSCTQWPTPLQRSAGVKVRDSRAVRVIVKWESSSPLAVSVGLSPPTMETPLQPTSWTDELTRTLSLPTRLTPLWLPP
eukprot:4450359-Pleurochrysis_carterae.AAC.2